MNPDNVSYAIDELLSCGGMYSRDLLQRAVDIYSTTFQDEVPLSLLTSAARTFRSSELMSELLDRVREGNGVRNWNEFSRRFLQNKTST